MISKILSVLLLSVSAMAIDTSRCPVEIDFDAKVEKVHKSSIYSKVPGWKEAQSSLVATKNIQTRFELSQKKMNACVYKDDGQNTATLTTSSFNDPEEWEPVLEDRLIVNFKIDKSAYVTFLPIESYNRGFVKTYSSPYSLKIKTQLFSKETNRTSTYDLGMISVVVK